MRKLVLVASLMAILMIVLAGSARAGVLDGPVINPANGNEYYLISTPSWTAAEAEAVSLGGHLVTIRSAEENAWVFDTIIAGRAFNPWIGLNDAAVEGTFVWSSGEPVTYTNWKPGEPNNTGGEDYARIEFGPGWNDVPNTSGNTEHGIVEVVTPSPDTDGDGTVDDFDNCPDDYNPGQEDADDDGVGDLCNHAIDVDGDDYADDLDNCPDFYNPDQANADGDQFGDLCDDFPNDPNNDLVQCSLDLGACQIHLIECQGGAAQCASELADAQALAAQCSADLVACNADLATSNDQLSECSANFAACSDSLAQLEVDLSMTQGALNQIQGELDQALMDLAEATADSDGDDVRDTGDTCPGTDLAGDVDGFGCSLQQFCAAVDTSTKDGERICKSSDWQNDEPITSPKDCAIQKQGRGEPPLCVPVQ